MQPPATTTYNHLDIPFVYPPLALLGAAAVGEVAGVATMDIFRWMPFLVSLLGVGAFAWLARRLLPRVAAVGATLAYALMPHAYDWVIAGGGLTRGLGLLFALLACAVAADRQPPSLRSPILAGALLGLSALAHPQAPVFGVLACLIVSWSRPMLTWLRNVGVAAATAVIVVLPWLVWADRRTDPMRWWPLRYRFDPLIGLIQMLNLRFSGAPFMDVFAVFGLLGLIVSVLTGRFRLPLLLLATYVSNQGAGDFLAAVPWSLLAGAGVAALVSFVADVPVGMAPGLRRAGVVAVASVVLLSMVASLGSYVTIVEAPRPRRAQIEAMAWLADNSDPNATVLVPTDEAWRYDEISEWLPALAAFIASALSRVPSGWGPKRFDRNGRSTRRCGVRRRTVAATETMTPTPFSSFPRASWQGRSRRATAARRCARASRRAAT